MLLFLIPGIWYEKEIKVLICFDAFPGEISSDNYSCSAVFSFSPSYDMALVQQLNLDDRPLRKAIVSFGYGRDSVCVGDAGEATGLFLR